MKGGEIFSAYSAMLGIASVISSNYNYDHVLHLSLLFYEAQRSGHLPPQNRISWRGDSALYDRGINGEDLTGGYYDGNYTRFIFFFLFCFV